MPDPSYGRAKLVRLTARGCRVHGTLVRVRRAFEKEICSQLGGDEWRQLRALLEEFAAWSRSNSKPGLRAVVRDRRKEVRLNIPALCRPSSNKHSQFAAAISAIVSLYGALPGLVAKSHFLALRRF